MSITGLCLYIYQMLALKPLPGRVLVEIREKYTHVATMEQKYDTKTSGVCLDLVFDNHTQEWTKVDLEDAYAVLVDKLVFWEEYKEGQVLERDGKKYAFIKIEDLDGYEDVESNA